MGLDPDDNSYPAGDRCEQCFEELFGGVTPKYILAIVQDIVKCPGIVHPPGPPPNGAFLMPQVAPCYWQLHIGEYLLNYELSPTQSKFFIAEQFWPWFECLIEDTCYDAFPNQLECYEQDILGHEGYVTCWWGPQIDKGPCS